MPGASPLPEASTFRSGPASNHDRTASTVDDVDQLLERADLGPTPVQGHSHHPTIMAAPAAIINQLARRMVIRATVKVTFDSFLTILYATRSPPVAVHLRQRAAGRALCSRRRSGRAWC
jgi:hypothetical protein